MSAQARQGRHFHQLPTQLEVLKQAVLADGALAPAAQQAASDLRTGTVSATLALPANADLRYIDISSNVRLNGADIGKTKINPWVATIGVGYRF